MQMAACTGESFPFVHYPEKKSGSSPAIDKRHRSASDEGHFIKLSSGALINPPRGWIRPRLHVHLVLQRKRNKGWWSKRSTKEPKLRGRQAHPVDSRKREKRGSENRYKIMSIFYRLLTEGITCPEHIFDLAILQKQTHSGRHTTWWQLTRDKTRFNNVLGTGWHSESYWSSQCIPWCLVI